MSSKIWAALICGVLLALVSTADVAKGQAKVEVVGDQPIPKGYQSWSLFVICNQQWLLAENAAKLSNLYTQFNAFGDAIGAKHLAVWFSKSRPVAGQPVNVDSSQTAAFCTKMKLLPSRSPYIVVTTTYPDLKADTLKPDVLIELNDLPPADIESLLSRLADQLLVQGLRQAEFNSEQYWGVWRRGVEAIGGFLGSLIRTVKITINTGPVKFEVEGGPAR